MSADSRSPDSDAGGPSGPGGDEFRDFREVYEIEGVLVTIT